MISVPRRAWLAGAALAVAAGAWLIVSTSRRDEAREAETAVPEVLSEASSSEVRAACAGCHVFPPPDMLPREYWVTAIRGMYQIAGRRGIAMPVPVDRVLAWYVLQAPERLPPAPGRTDAGPGRVAWERREWRPDAESLAAPRAPAVTHVCMAPLLGGSGLDVLVSDVTTNRVYALRPYAPEQPAVVVGTVAHPGRVAVTDLDRDGATDLVVAALGQLKPTNDTVGSVTWFRRTGPESFEPVVLADGLGRVADVQAADLNSDGRTDLLVAVFGWMENGGLLWLENTGRAARPSFVPHVLDARPGFSDVRATDLDRDGRLDVVALISQEFQQVMAYRGGPEGYRAESVWQAPNPDWGFSGLEVADFTGDGLPDLIVTNGDNLDLTVAKPYHGVGLLENLGDGRFEYRHLTAMYGAHRAVPVDLTGEGRVGLLVSAYLPPTVAAPAPAEALVWLERVGPTRLVRRVLESDDVVFMTMAAGDATGDGRPDIALGFMDLGGVDPAQAHRGPPLPAWVSLWKNLGSEASGAERPDAEVIDWRAGTGSGSDGGASIPGPGRAPGDPDLRDGRRK